MKVNLPLALLGIGLALANWEFKRRRDAYGDNIPDGLNEIENSVARKHLSPAQLGKYADLFRDGPRYGVKVTLTDD